MGGPDQTGGAFSISCYSRALVIELDFERKVFRRAWQFAATNATMRGGTTADDELPSSEESIGSCAPRGVATLLSRRAAVRGLTELTVSEGWLY